METTALAISNGALRGKKLPDRIKILNFGANPSQRGVFRVNEDSLAALQRQIAEKAFERIVIDFEHNSQPGTPHYTPPPRKHAGYGSLRADKDGVWLEAIQWTPAGREFACEYSDLSPTIQHENGVVQAITSVSLCTNGALDDVTFFTADAPGTQKQKGSNMEQVEQLTAKLDEQKAQIAALTATVEKQTAALAAQEPLMAKVKALQEQLTALSAKVEAQQAAFEADLVRRDKEALLNGAARDGKVVALNAEAIGKLSLDELKDHISKLKPTVPLSARTPGFVPEDAEALNSARQTIAKNCGVDPAKVK